MIKECRLPLSKKDIQQLRVGDIVYLSGTFFTARDEAHRLLLDKDPSSLPFDPNKMALYYCGPLMKKIKEGWKVVSAGPTTSGRMDDIASDVIDRLSVRAIIGKGAIGKKTKDALKDKGVFFVFTGGAGALAADLISSVDNVFWLDELGMTEAVWIFTVNRFGPLVVAIDAEGNSVF
jgi:tartrate/fumarate subfamily iron-sulfur-dependent hydro-lyase beta chain